MDTNLPQLLTRLALDVAQAQRGLETARPGWRFESFQIDLPVEAHRGETRGFSVGVEVLFFPLTQYYHVGRKDISQQCRIRLDVEAAPPLSLTPTNEQGAHHAHASLAPRQ